MLKTLEDFEGAIGKTIYRDSNGCPCPDCKYIEANGLVVRDELHAEYLSGIQEEYLFDGIKLNYRLEK